MLVSMLLAATGCRTDGVADGGLDASFDTGLDAPYMRRDSGIDARDAPGAPGWVAVRGSYPDTVRLEVATPALVAATSFPIEPCPDRPGCRRIVQTWESTCTTPIECHPFQSMSEHGVHDGTRGIVVIGRDVSMLDHELWALDDSGRALAGFRAARADPWSLVLAFPTVDAENLAFFLGWTDPDLTAHSIVVLAPLGSPFSLEELGDAEAATASTGDFLQEISLGPDAVAGELSSLRIVRLARDGTGVEVVSDAADGVANRATARAGAIFYSTYDGSLAHTHVARTGEPPELLVSGPRLASDLVATDGIDLVWLAHDERAGDSYANPEIWTAPYTDRPADLVPRLIDQLDPADVGITSPIRVGFGHAAYMLWNGTLRIYRLADGFRADLGPPPGGEYHQAPSYLGPEEIAVASFAPSVASTRQLRFIRLDSLDWQPPP